MRNHLLDTVPVAALLLGRPRAASLMSPWLRDHEAAASIIGDIDTLIAATALEHDLTPVTTDAHFQRVSALKLMHLASLR